MSSTPVPSPDPAPVHKKRWTWRNLFPQPSTNPEGKQGDRQPFTEPLTDHEQEQIRKRAYAIWRDRKADGKTTATDDWNEAVEQLKAEQALQSRPGKQLREIRQWLWQSTGLEGKTLWDISQVLTVPIVLALVGWGLQEYAKDRDKAQQAADREKEEAAALDKARQDTLVKYLDQMADSLGDGLLEAKPGDDKFIVAQARTVIALQSLDRNRQNLVIQFLSAAGLNQAREDIDLEGFEPWASEPLKLPDGNRVLLLQAQMEKANLAGSDLSGAVLIGASLQQANLGCNPPESREHDQCSDLGGADFRGAILLNANLRNANLSYANLSGADLSDAHLTGANLSGTDFSDAYLNRADLRNAILMGAILSSANLSDADFSGAILLATDLRTALNFTQEQLKGDEPPLLCNAAFPPGITIDPDKDCDRLPQILFERYPDDFQTLDNAKQVVESIRTLRP